MIEIVTFSKLWVFM